MSELREAAEEALRWMEHARLHLTIKERMHPDGLGLYDNAAEALRAALAQPEAEAEPVAWQVRWIDPEEGPGAWRFCLDPSEADYYANREDHRTRHVLVKKGDDMSTLREAAQAAPDAEVRAQHKEFARWFLELSDKSALASEYLAWLAWKAALAHPPRNEWREAVHDELVTTWTLSAENKDDPRKALQDIINWHVRVSLDPAVSSDARALVERGKAMRDEWRPASEPPEDGRRVLIWVAKSGGETFRPAYCPAGGWTSVFDGETLVAWRDVTPPTESTIAAKCQRIEGSGEICGLTPPCPDCGSSLIDVADGSL